MAKPAAIVVGAGIGGICAAIRLRQAGYQDVLIFDRNAGVGGVWYENRYPGCACDVPIPLYQLSFAPGFAWNHTFPRSAEIQSYVEGVVDQFQLRPCLRLSEGVVSAAWDEAAKLWRIETDKGATLEAGVLVAAMGQLNRPAWPDIPGRDNFMGRSVHAARWDDTIRLEDQRIGVIGSAASAVQLIPEVAKLAKHLTVFQRTPNWVVPRNDQAITDEQKALLMTAPEIALKLGAAQREAIWENADYFFWQAFEWTPQGRAAFTRQALDHMHAQVPDPALREKLTPDYPIGCKRVLITDDFYPALMRDNVSLETTPIDAINAWGVKLDDGTQIDFDVLIYATGFETTGWHWSMDVTGEGGKHLNALWADHPEAYLGTTVAGFPNLFVLYGPNTNLGHNSIIYMLECQVDYMIRALQEAENAGARALAPSQQAQDQFNAELQRALEKTVWADPQCVSWYKNEKGRITQNWSGPTRDFAKAVEQVRLDDYILIP